MRLEKSCLEVGTYGLRPQEKALAEISLFIALHYAHLLVGTATSTLVFSLFWLDLFRSLPYDPIK